jgi:GNAT superfamily N-acetyltransferase
MTLELRRGDFEAFFEAPFQAYGPESLYVSPMKGDLKRFVDPRANPVFAGTDDVAIFTAHRLGRPVGRITAHVHRASNALHGWSRACFGYFDCADDAEAARLLLEAAEDWGRQRGFAEIMGNFNLTAMQQIGVTTGGFEREPYTDLVWSPPHIARLLQRNGYEATFPMTTFEVDLATAPLPEMGEKQQAVLADPDFAFAPITRRNVVERMEEARLILNASFAKNPMFVAVSREEFHFQARDMKWVIDPRISAMLHHQGRPAACILCVPDMNPFLKATRSRMGLAAPWRFLQHKLTCDRAVLIFSGVVPDLQGQGVNPVVLRRVLEGMRSAGYRTLGNTWIADVNGPSLAQKRKSGARPLHRLHLFRKDLR